uniref:Uncharacterized protein n=1 Tax=Strigops habroptila TaxID=2489341 RepID=A0A672TL02_STRHB
LVSFGRYQMKPRMCINPFSENGKSTVLLCFPNTMQQQPRRFEPTSYLSISFINGWYIILAGHYNMKIIANHSFHLILIGGTQDPKLYPHCLKKNLQVLCFVQAPAEHVTAHLHQFMAKHFIPHSGRAARTLLDKVLCLTNEMPFSRLFTI